MQPLNSRQIGLPAMDDIEMTRGILQGTIYNMEEQMSRGKMERNYELGITN